LYIAFVSSIGNIDQLKVQSRNTQSGVTGKLAYSTTSDDDTVTAATLTEGRKDDIKAQLELLDVVGTVTVSSNLISAKGECTWHVTFDTNAGDLPQMTVSLSDGTVQTGRSDSETINAETTVVIDNVQKYQ